jgi:hypothetical protein
MKGPSMTGPSGPAIPKPAKPRLTPEEVLERMIEVQRRFEVDAAFRRPERDPWRRLFWVLGGGLAFTTIALLMLQMALSRGSPALLPSPQRSWVAPSSTALSLFVVPSGGARILVHSGSALMVAASGEALHLQAEGMAEDRDALLLAEDEFGRLSTVWPHGGALQGGPCPGDCTRLDFLLAARALPAGNIHLALWVGPGPLDASNLQHLGRGGPPALSGSRASAWLELER